MNAQKLDGLLGASVNIRLAGAPEAQKPEEDQDRRPKAMMDGYAPGEQPEPSGRYWMGRDEEGQPKLHFDDPGQAAGAPKKPEEKWMGNTDKVDREIERLKKKKQELEQRINTEADEARIRDLERQLAQVERELQQKDNDAYRRQRCAFTRIA